MLSEYEKVKKDFLSGRIKGCRAYFENNGVKLENNTALLKGVVSRKKQVVPIMTENA